MLLVLLAALLLTLFVRLGEEASFDVTGPLLGASPAALMSPHDRSAIIKGGALGGLVQGVIAMMVFKRGYILPDVTIITGTQYLASLAVHLVSGLGFRVLLFLALRWARPG